jgi:hypothetical protein
MLSSWSVLTATLHEAIQAILVISGMYFDKCLSNEKYLQQT